MYFIFHLHNLNKVQQKTSKISLMFWLVICPATNSSLITPFDSCNLHCVKSIQKQSYFWFVFSCIRIEYKRYFVSLRIQSECKKIRTRNNSVFGHFSRSAYLINPFVFNVPFLYPLKTSENLKFLWCFQGGRERVHWEQKLLEYLFETWWYFLLNLFSFFFCGVIIDPTKPVTIVTKTLHHRCLAVFEMRLIFDSFTWFWIPQKNLWLKYLSDKPGIWLYPTTKFDENIFLGMVYLPISFHLFRENNNFLL